MGLKMKLVDVDADAGTGGLDLELVDWIAGGCIGRWITTHSIIPPVDFANL